MEFISGSDVGRKLRGIIRSDNPRSQKVKVNILSNFLIKGLSIGVSLLFVPLTIKYINSSQYGVWLTLTSLVAWLSFFDIGFGNGLRNRLSEAIAKGDFELCRSYVSTTYAALTIIILFVSLIFVFISPVVNWNRILNSQLGEYDIRNLVRIIFLSFSFQFLFQLIFVILTANQEPSKASFINLLGNICSLAIVLVMTQTLPASLLNFGAAVSIVPVVVTIISSYFLFSTSYQLFRPSLRYVNFRLIRSIMGLGLKFFIIQLGFILNFNVNNIIINQLLGPDQVTLYNVTFKLFSVTTMIFSIVAAPLWSAFSDAYIRGDFKWMNKAISKMKWVWIVLSCFSLLLLLLSNTIFSIWLDDTVRVPFLLSMAMNLYICGYMWQTMHVYLLNGTGKIQLQLFLVVIIGIANIPLSIMACQKYGIVGITFLNSLLVIISGIIYSRQAQMILNGTAKKIWNR